MHMEFPVSIAEPPSKGEDRLLARTGVLEPGHPVDEFPAYDVQVTVPVEIRDAGHRRPVGLQIGIPGFQAAALVILSIHVLEEVDESPQRTVGPCSGGIICIIPSVFFPCVDSNEDVLVPVCVPVHKRPHVEPHPLVEVLEPVS